MFKTMEIVYDESYDIIDGDGWKVLTESGEFIYRFPTMAKAKEWCIKNHFEYSIHNAGINKQFPLV